MHVQSKRTDGPHVGVSPWPIGVGPHLTPARSARVPLCSSLKVVPVGMSKGVKKLMQERFPNMNKLEDISELLIK